METEATQRPQFRPDPDLRLMDQVREVLRYTSIRVLQELLGYADVKTTEIYTHVMTRDIRHLESPLDRLYG